MNQLRAIMLEVAPVVLDRQWAGPKIDSAVMRRILKRYPVFTGLERARRSTILGILKACRCRLNTREAAVDALLGIPEEILIPDGELTVVSTEIEIIIQQIELAESAISKLESRIRPLVNEHPICIKLMEMPGIGLARTSHNSLCSAWERAGTTGFEGIETHSRRYVDSCVRLGWVREGFWWKKAHRSRGAFRC
jgi:hypothetical protein